MATPHDMMDDDDALPPLLNFDGENVVTASSSTRTSSNLRRRRSSSGMNPQGPTQAQLKRARTRQFSTSSMEDLFPPRFQPTEANKSVNDDFEQSSSSSKKLLAFFAVPVFAGLMFENGASISIDIILVGLACLLLYWSIEIPWQWYFYARTLAVDASPRRASEVIDDSEDEELDTEDGKTLDTDAPSENDMVKDVDRTETAEWRMLHAYELYALALCFIAPPATAYLLHRIRVYLSKPTDSPIESASFILFVLAAELMPLNHACKLLFAHTLYLQRIVSSYDILEDDKVKELKQTVEKRETEYSRQLEEMSRSIAELQTRLLTAQPPSPPPESNRTPPGSSSDLVKQSNSTQTQVDALNRAVRRYEKRAITQAMMTEARLRELDARINDALTLAAAASRSTQSGGFFVWLFELAGWFFALPLQMLHALFTWPIEAVNDVYRFLLGPRRKKSKRSGGGSKERERGSSSGAEVRGRYRLEKR